MDKFAIYCSLCQKWNTVFKCTSISFWDFLFLGIRRSVMPSENPSYHCEHPLKIDKLTRRSHRLLAFLSQLGRMSLNAEGTPLSCFPNCGSGLKKLQLLFGHGVDKLRGSHFIRSVIPPLCFITSLPAWPRHTAPWVECPVFLISPALSVWRT